MYTQQPHPDDSERDRYLASMFPSEHALEGRLLNDHALDLVQLVFDEFMMASGDTSVRMHTHLRPRSNGPRLRALQWIGLKGLR